MTLSRLRPRGCRASRARRASVLRWAAAPVGGAPLASMDSPPNVLSSTMRTPSDAGLTAFSRRRPNIALSPTMGEEAHLGTAWGPAQARGGKYVPASNEILSSACGLTGRLQRAQHSHCTDGSPARSDDRRRAAVHV